MFWALFYESQYITMINKRDIWGESLLINLIRFIGPKWYEGTSRAIIISHNRDLLCYKANMLHSCHNGALTWILIIYLHAWLPYKKWNFFRKIPIRDLVYLVVLSIYQVPNILLMFNNEVINQAVSKPRPATCSCK